MRAEELAHPIPAVRAGTRLAEVLAVLVREGLPGVVVLDAQGRPWAELSLCQVLGLLLPWPVRYRPNLAGSLPERLADRMLQETLQRPIGDLVPVGDPRHCSVRRDASALEVVTAMTRHHSLVALVQGAPAGSDVISAADLLTRLARE